MPAGAEQAALRDGILVASAMPHMVLFLVAVMVVLSLGYLYLGRRLIAPAGLKAAASRLAWITLGLLTIFLLFGPAAGHLWTAPDRPAWLEALIRASFITMGFFPLVIAALLLVDAVRFARAALGKLAGALAGRHRLFGNRGGAADARRSLRPEGDGRGQAEGHALPSAFQSGDSGPAPPLDPGRRRLLANAVNLGVLGFSAALTGVGYGEARRRPILEELSIPIPNLPPALEGLRIVQITDLHIGPTITRDFVEAAVEDAMRLRPDLVAVTGDLVDGYIPQIRDHVAPVAGLSAPLGVYFVTGNHEYFWGADAWEAEVGRMGLTVLHNDHRLVEKGGGRLLVAGVTDVTGGLFSPRHHSDPVSALGVAPDADVRILLAHQPRSCFAAAGAGFDLQLSGHTHGGQFIPWNFLVRLQQPFVLGLHRFGGMWVYVSRGTGYWGPPLRLGIPSEVTLLTLTSAPVSFGTRLRRAVKSDTGRRA